MKIRISKAEYDALPEAMRLIYVADGDGYKLPLLESEDPAAALRARDREKADAATAKAELARVKAELDTLRVDPARKTGDIAVLEKSWSDKLLARENELTGQITTLKTKLESVLIDHAASTFAGEITAKPENASIMLPHVRSRFEVVYDGDEPSVKIKDATGRVSAMNTDELRKEFVSDKKYASIVIVNKASGAGGSGAGNGGSGGAGNGKKKFGEMTGVEKSELFKSDPNYFQQLATEYKNEQATTRFAR